MIQYLLIFTFTLVASLLFRFGWTQIFHPDLRWLKETLTVVLVLGLLYVLWETPDPDKPAPAPTTIYADTTRTKLVHRADSSENALTIIHLRTSASLQTYGQAIERYDSIRVALP